LGAREIKIIGFSFERISYLFVLSYYCTLAPGYFEFLKLSFHFKFRVLLMPFIDNWISPLLVASLMSIIFILNLFLVFRSSFFGSIFFGFFYSSFYLIRSGLGWVTHYEYLLILVIFGLTFVSKDNEVQAKQNRMSQFQLIALSYVISIYTVEGISKVFFLLNSSDWKSDVMLLYDFHFNRFGISARSELKSWFHLGYIGTCILQLSGLFVGLFFYGWVIIWLILIVIFHILGYFFVGIFFHGHFVALLILIVLKYANDKSKSKRSDT